MNQMIRSVVKLSCVILLGFALATGALSGCTSSKTNTSGGQGSAGKKFLKLGTAPIGGAFNLVGGALAEVLNQHKPDGVGKFEAAATKGSQQNIRDIDQGELDFALSNSAITYFAIRGEGKWGKKYNIRAVMTLAPNVAMFITTKPSGIRQITDLKGKRVCVGPAGAGFEYFVGPLLKAHGVSYDDFSPQHASQSGAVDLLGDGSIGAAFLGGAVPTASIVQACSSQDVVFIPFDPQVLKQLTAKYVFFKPATIPAGTYSDLKEDFHGLNVGSMHLITSGSQDDELVYQVTKTIYENRADVVKRHPAGKAINPKVCVMNTGTQFHSGAIRFYKEIGIWPETADSPASGKTAATKTKSKADGPTDTAGK